MKNIESRINELKNLIKYEEKKMGCCAYGTRELMYLEELKEELEQLEEEI